MKFIRKNVLWILSVFSSAILLLSVMYNKFIPTGLEYVIGTFACSYMFLSGLRFPKTIKVLIILVILVSSGLFFYTEYSAERIINYVPNETSVITFVVLKDSKITKIEETDNLKFGVSETTDSLTQTYLIDQLKTKIAKYSWNSTSDDQTNMEMLFSGEIDVLVLDNSVRGYLVELDPQFERKTKIIWTIEKSSIKEVIVKEVDISKKAFVVLISGIDISGPISLRSRSDVNIIMVVNPKTNKILTISIPRDTYAPLGCKTGALDKLTHSGIYGINCTVKTIENLVGIDVNYYVRVNFSSLIKIINVIGNIDVYSKYAFTTENGTHFNSGINSLDSTKALTFARARHQFESGDIQRGLNQQEVIKGLINKLISPSTLTKTSGIILATSKSIDTNMTTEDISKLVKKQLENNQPWEITTSNLSGVGEMRPTYSMGDRLLYVMQPNKDSLALKKKNIEEYLNIGK